MEQIIYFDSVNKFASENQSNKTKQQTAVEWLVEQLLDGKLLMPSLIEQAKAIEKEHIMNAAKIDLGWECTTTTKTNKAAEDYYNETYKK
jgi:hypothetical protein